MKKANFSPLQERLTRHDIAAFKIKANIFLSFAATVMLAVIIFIAFASVLLVIDIDAFNTPPFWLTAGLATLLVAAWWHFYMVDDRDYLVRLKKFAAMNNFSYTEKAERKLVVDEPISVISKAEEYCKTVYDAHVVKGRSHGMSFRLGVHTAEYPAPESGTNYLRVGFLEVKRKQSFPHILVVGEGKAVPHSILKRLWALPQPIETDFQQYFQVYLLEGKKEWKKVIPQELQNALMQYAKNFDIEIKGNTISFYQKNRLNLRKVEHTLEIARLFE